MIIFKLDYKIFLEHDINFEILPIFYYEKLKSLSLVMFFEITTIKPQARFSRLTDKLLKVGTA